MTMFLSLDDVLISSNVHLNKSAWYSATDKEIYSTSIVESATLNCFLEIHEP